jgi:hypothetical protein
MDFAEVLNLAGIKTLLNSDFNRTATESGDDFMSFFRKMSNTPADTYRDSIG